jgi:hypothetical protein
MASTSDASSATGEGNWKAKGKDPMTIDAMLEQLDLQDEEFNDLDVDEVEQEILESVQWMALARVHTEKSFSHAAFFGEMRAAWNLAQVVKFRAIGENLFTLQASCLGDWERIVDNGPWLFRNWAVIIEPYDGLSRAEEKELFHIKLWIQIHELPEGYCKSKIITQLVERAGLEVITVKTEGIRGNYVRVRVRFDVRKPLARCVSIIRQTQRQLFVVRYEKLAFFCEACGKLGHGFKECGRGVYEEKDLKFKRWLYADPPRTGFGGGFSGNRGGGGLGRGGLGRGRGRSMPTYDDEEGDELKDTGTSPIKPMDTNTLDATTNARKRINFGGNDPEEEAEQTGQLVVKDVDMTTGESADESSTSSVDSKGNKRAKKGNGNKQNLEKLAGSLEECRQSQ